MTVFGTVSGNVVLLSVARFWETYFDFNWGGAVKFLVIWARTQPCADSAELTSTFFVIGSKRIKLSFKVCVLFLL
jgi:hypothetical protein